MTGPAGVLVEGVRRDPKWWVAFGIIAALVVGYSVAVGQYLSTLRQPEVIGHSVVGEWADLSDYGFRIRVDSMEYFDALPGSWDPSQVNEPPEGMKYLRVLYTVEALVPPEGDLGCIVDLRNGDGEELDLTEIGLAGPEGEGCTRYDGRDGIAVGDTYETQSVFVVQPVPIEDYTIVITPMFADERVHWEITA